VVERPEYEGKLSTARRRIGKRDPDDVDYWRWRFI